MDRVPQTTGRSGGRGRTRGAHSGRAGGRAQDGGRGGRGGDRAHNRQPSKDDNQHGGGGAGRERNHGGRGGHRDHGPGKGGRHARGHSTFSSGSPRPGTAPDGGPTPAEATPQQSPTKVVPESAAPTTRPQTSAGPKPGGSWANLLKSSPAPGAAAAAATSGSAATTSANNIASATAPAAPSAAAVTAGTVSTPSSATAAQAAAAASTAAAPEAAAPAPPTAAAVVASAAAAEDASAAPLAAPSTDAGPSRPQSEATPAPAAKSAPAAVVPTPPIDYAAAVSANAPQTAAAVVAGGVAPAPSAAPVAPTGTPSAPGVVPGNVPAMASGAPASGAVPIVAAGPGVPIPVGPIHNMTMPAMPAISVQGPVPGGQTMPGGAGRGQGAAMSPRPGGPGGPGPAYNAAAVIQGGPRPGPGGFPMYAAPMQAYGGRMVPAAFHMAGVPMNNNARMGPHYGPHMMPMGGRNYKQAHQGGRGGGRGGAGGGGGGNAAAAAGGSSSGAAPAAEGSSPGSASGGAGRGAGRGTSQEPPKHAGLTIHRAGAGSGPVRSRPQSAVEPRSTPPEPFDNEGKGISTPRSQQRSASAISHRSDTGTPTLDSTPKKLTIRKPGSTPSKSPDKSGRPASGKSTSTQSTASPQKPETAATVRKGSPDENECPEPRDNGAAPTPNGQAAEDGAANSGGPPKSAAAAAADAAATAACASVAASSTPSVAARETRSQAVNSQSPAPSPTPPEDLPPPPAAAPSADEPAPAAAAAESTPPPPSKPLADASTKSAKSEPPAKASQSQPTSSGAAEALPPPPSAKVPQPVSTASTEAAPPPPTPAQPTESSVSQAANGTQKRRYTRKFMCAVQNIPGEPVNKYGITMTREDLRNITFDDLDDKFIGTMHKLLHRDDTGIIATEERRQSIQERAGNMRMRRTGSHANRGDDGGRSSSARGRGGGMWGDDHGHQGARGGRGGGDRSQLGNHRQGSGNRDDQWGRRPGGGNERQGPGSFSEWSANKKPAPPPPGAEMLRAENAYKKGKLLSDDPEEEAKQRTFTSLINKLTIDNFDRIVNHMGEIEVTDAKTLKGFVAKIFNKALTESIFCEMYASLCKQLLHIMPRFETETTTADGTKKTIHQDIRSLVLSECQYQFTLGRTAKNADAQPELDTTGMTEQEKKVAIAKAEEENLRVRRRAMGNMQFVGHLYKAAMITEKIVHVCFQELLKDPTSEEVECVCKLLATAGPFLQNAKHNPELFPVYIGRLEGISTNKEKFDSRIRFLILDTLELSRNQWQGRVKPEGPRRIDEIHKDAMREEAAAKLRNNQRGGYDRHGGGNYGGGYQHGGPPRPPQMDIRVNPRAMNPSMLPTTSLTSGRPGGPRRQPHSAGGDRSNDNREQHGGRGGGAGSWSNRNQSGGDREPAGGSAALPPPPPRPAPGKEAAPAAEPAPPQMTPDEVRRKVKLMLGEFGSSQKENEAVLSCEELMAQGAPAAAVYAHLLCELTSMHKEEAQFAEKRDFWLQMLQKPLGDAACKDILSDLLQLLPELFDENIKAVKLIGASIGGMLTSKQLTPVDVFNAFTTPEEEGEEAPLVDSAHAAQLFMAALTASDTDIPALKASGSIEAKALVPSYQQSKLQDDAAKTGLDQLL